MSEKQYKVAVWVLLGSLFCVFHAGQSKVKSSSGNRAAVQKKSVGSSAAKTKGLLDFSVLPVVKGSVAQYLPTPYGNLGGLLLTDGTQVIFSTMFGESVKSFVHPGQTIRIQGLRAYGLPFVQAFQIINQNGEKIREDSPDASFPPVPVTGPDLSVSGTIRQMLYNLQGQVMGMVLKDGTAVYIRTSDIKRLDFPLKPGEKIFVHGIGSMNALGKAIQVRSIGQTENTVVELLQFNAPPAGAPAGSPMYDYIPE